MVAHIELSNPAMKNKNPSRNTDTPAIISELIPCINPKSVFYYKNQ